jgi:hypothetical protein
MTRQTKSPIARWSAALTAGVVAITAGCDPFTVSDPSRYTDEALDAALDAVANGAEGQFHLALDEYVIYTGLLGDELMHTGTWTGYEDLSNGTARYATPGTNTYTDGLMNSLLRARYATQDAEARFTRLAVADADPKMVQVKSTEGWIDLYLGEGYCEVPSGQGTATVSDQQLYLQAITELKGALSLAQQANLTPWVNYDRAGIARAYLLAGGLATQAGNASYDSAAAYARQVPDGFIKYADFSINSGAQNNSVVQLETVGYNKAAGMRPKWWPMVDTVASKLRDPWTGQLDPRVEIKHPAGSLGVDGRTPHYSQWKYQALGDDIPITKSEEMRLIEAEVAWRGNDLTAAVGIMNALRAQVGLGALPDPAGDASTVLQYLLSERFATMFMEGRRLADLYRFNLVPSALAAGRLEKFPISQFEAQNNPNIGDVSSQRCVPIS